MITVRTEIDMIKPIDGGRVARVAFKNGLSFLMDKDELSNITLRPFMMFDITIKQVPYEWNASHLSCKRVIESESDWGNGEGGYGKRYEYDFTGMVMKTKEDLPLKPRKYYKFGFKQVNK